MSRSYKKMPVVKDSSCKGSTFKSGKQIANRAVRKQKDIPNGGSYKKVYCSWNISDWRFMKTEADLRREWDSGDEYLHRMYKTYEQARFAWKKALSITMERLTSILPR